jgi:hypothetical protein
MLLAAAERRLANTIALFDGLAITGSRTFLDALQRAARRSAR